MVAEPLLGSTVRGYHIREKIGVGGQGVVYLAHEIEVDRPVAIKLILPEYANNPAFIANFNAEARLIAKLEHAHIVPLYTYWQDDNGAFLVMRYIGGGSLRKRLQPPTPFTVEHTLRLVGQIASALHAAHTAGIIHRDLKPENILLDEQGSAYLTDFGFAKRADVSEELPSTGIIGTAAYMAPEQIEEVAVSPQTDIYALGILVYELLTGQHPFTDASITALLMAHLREPLPSVLAVQPELPEAVDDVLAQATRKQPTERYASVLDFARELEAVFRPAAAPVVPASPEARNRAAMLQNVKSWVDGILVDGGQNTPRLPLRLQPALHYIDNPRSRILPQMQANAAQRLDATSVVESFDRANGKLLILGDPGSGKTTSLLELARELIYRAEAHPQHTIPIILNLSAWSEGRQPLDVWLADELHNKYQVPEAVAKAWIAANELLLLLDGLDEVAAEHREACVQAINAYCEAYGFVQVVVCSRLQDYQALAQQLSLNGAVVIQPLAAADVQQYLTMLGTEGRGVWARLAADPHLSALSRSPLMLNIIVQARDSVTNPALPPVHDQTAPDQAEEDEALSTGVWRQRLFEGYVTHMLQSRPANSAYTPAQVLHGLTQLARQMNERTQTVFLIENLQPDWLPTPYQRHFRLLFTALLVVLHALVWGIPRYLLTDMGDTGNPDVLRGLVWGGAAALWGFMLGMGYYRRLFAAPLVGLAFACGVAYDSLGSGNLRAVLLQFIPGFIVYTIVFLVIIWVLKRRITSADKIESVDLLRFQRRSIHPMIYFAGFVGGVGTAVLHNTYSVIDSTLPVTPLDRILSIGIGAPVSSLVTAYTASFTSVGVREAVRPNEGMRQTLRNSLRMGLIITVGLTICLFATSVTVTSVHYIAVHVLITTLPFGFIGGLIYGGYYVLKHAVLRYLLARYKIIPLNLARFLDHTVRLGLMRRAGGSYLFEHGLLRDYFAQHGAAHPSASANT